jgi:hypothetical protein
MTQEQADRLGFGSLVAALAAAGVGVSLWFAPGWANGWPGLPQQVVWPVGVTLVTFLFAASLVVACGAAFRSLFRGRAADWAFVAWCASGVVLGVIGCWWLYEVLHSGAVELWP